MISRIIKTSLIGLAFLIASCGVKERTAQIQSSGNSNSNPTTTTNPGASQQIPSNENGNNKKEVDYYAHLKPEHREILQAWLKTKAYLRPAVEEIDNTMFLEKYKEFFEGNMKFLRETVGENGYQYYSIGDMNQDGKEDFAVLLVDTRKQKEDDDHFALAIFNAPLKQGAAPAYFEENLYGISNSYLVFDKMSEKHLFLGKLESDALCATYYPKGKTYFFKDCMN